MHGRRLSVSRRPRITRKTPVIHCTIWEIRGSRTGRNDRDVAFIAVRLPKRCDWAYLTETLRSLAGFTDALAHFGFN